MTLVGDPNNQRNLKDDAPEAQRIAMTIFQKNPNLRVLVVYNSASATGAIAAAQQAGVADKVLIATMAGEDTNVDQVKKGTLALTYDLNGLDYGKVMGQMVAKALSGTKMTNEVIDAPTGTIYTKDNVGTYIPWSQRLTYADIPSKF